MGFSPSSEVAIALDYQVISTGSNKVTFSFRFGPSALFSFLSSAVPLPIQGKIEIKMRIGLGFRFGRLNSLT